MSQDKTPDIRLEPVAEIELSAYEALYCDAFPASERKPFALLKTRAAEGTAELLSIRFDGIFAGLAVTLLDGPYVLIDYLAVSPAFRNHGIGASGLGLLRARYPDRLLFLEIEEPETEIQERRRNFYIRNGILPTGLAVKLFGVDMLILSDGGRNVPFDDYAALLLHTVGPYTVGNVTFRSFTPQNNA